MLGGSRLKLAKDGGNLGIEMFGFSFSRGYSLLKRQRSLVYSP